MAERAHDIELAEARDITNANQASAADPGLSAWVSANAGTGKTYVLVLRVLRLLLAGTPPDRILCLTYTKAAAAEMSNRLFEKLGEWATIDDEQLATSLRGLLGANPTAGQIRDARQLFAYAIETPGGLKVQTIHSFCERILQRFPLEAGIAPNFSVLDEEQTRTIIRDSIDQVLNQAATGEDKDLSGALYTVTTHAIADHFDDILREALTERLGLRAAMSASTGELRAQLSKSFGLKTSETLQSVDSELAGLLSDNELREARDVLATSRKRDTQQAERAAAVLGLSEPHERADAMAIFFLTQKHQPRNALMTADLKDKNVVLHETLLKAQNRAVALQQKRLALAMIEATAALIRIAAEVIQIYQKHKALRSALDYDDLLEYAARLMSDRHAAQWVLFKLDNGIDHILVDEAQDTSPNAWVVIDSLGDEFFAGLGQKEVLRTIFAVGDEKQSIYSFQGAEPKLFAAKGKKYAAMAGDIGQSWKSIPLNLSFRTIHPILDAVDAVFTDPKLFGIESVLDTPMRHIAHRSGQGGLVEIWDTEKPVEPGESDIWQPNEDQAAREPAYRLAERIAATIEHWFTNNEMLVSENRRIEPGDILILVRKRQPLAQPLIRALKARNIPVAGTDRIRVMDQIAVQDLMALGDFLLLPEDDLALASVLKSPLFGLDDDDLFELSHKRRGSLWSVLFEVGRKNERFTEAAQLLARWRRQADFLPPFEFYARLLERDGCRKRMLARLGPDSADAIDEFLNLAIRYDEDAPPSMQGFLDWMRSSSPEIRRDMEQGKNEVRIMTVHGAKGLEAPVVFLGDTCSSRSGGDMTGISSRNIADWDVDLPLWKVKGSSYHQRVMEEKDAAKQDSREEYNRLLYVAMTRARDRLYICGFEGKLGRDKDCWYNLVDEKLRPACLEATDQLGHTVWQSRAEQTEPPNERAVEHDRYERQALPGWALERVPHIPQRVIPLAPSQLTPLEAEIEYDDLENLSAARAEEAKTGSRDLSSGQTVMSPTALSADNRFKRGLITHALLQYLPEVDPDSRRTAATKFVDLKGADLAATTRESIADETLKILERSEFAQIFSPRSRAEVAIAAEIPPPDGRGPDLKITGQIDRLVETPDKIYIIDYKTNRPPPVKIDDVATAYYLQLAAYRLAIRKVYPHKEEIRAALLWTHGPHLMEIPARILDYYEKELWNVDGSRLILTGGDSLPTFR